MELHALQNLLIALGLGLLVGLQREWATDEIAGIRTFPLIALFGVLSATLAERFGEWTLGASMLGLAAMLVLGNLAKLKKGKIDPGLTTEISALVMFAVGAALVIGYTATAIAVGGGVAVLLHWKRPLHDFVRRIGEQDFRAVIQFVLIALVILPVLPNRTFGPYEVLNPFKIWLMVVLIVGITLGAYVASKLLGGRLGTLLAGALGGLISSTATTVSQSRRAHESPAETNTATTVIMLASTIVFARVGFEVAIVAPELQATLGPPVVAMMGWMAVITLATFLVTRGRIEEARLKEPPSELRTAIVFGLLYAVVLLGITAAKQSFGQSGLYVVAGLSGMTDMDAITLSTAQLVKSGRLDAETGWRLILVGAMANLVFKAGIVGALGNRRLFARVVGLFTLGFLGGVALLLFWP